MTTPAPATTDQALPKIAATVTFIHEQDGLPFTGLVIKSYGFAVAVTDPFTSKIALLNEGTAWAPVRI